MSVDKLHKLVESVRPQILFDPGFYSGRGATLTDLTSSQLLFIQEKIRNEFGDKASKAFVVMVQNIKVMACTTFLKELENLYFRNWNIVLKENDKETDVYVTNEGNAFATATFGLAKAGMLGDYDQRDDTQDIKRLFLQKNGVKPHKEFFGKIGYKEVY